MTPLADRQIVFLMYENRSGSTFLASRLDLHPEIGVTIETETFADVLESGATIADDADLARIVRTFTTERKFAEWGIAAERLHAALAALPRPAGFDAILRTVLDLHFGGADISCYLVKGTRLTHHIARLRQAVPGARFLHILRDPRGVFASQKQAIGSDTAAAMNEDALDAARRWAANARRVDRVAGPDLLEVRYEDLIADHDRSMAAIRAFIMRGLPALADPGEMDGEAYLARIPADQRHLHANLLRKPRTDRIESWRTELSAVEIALSQRGAGEMLARKGYAVDATAVARAGRLVLLVTRLRLALATFARRLANARRYAAEGRFWWRVRVVLYRLRA
ncbi:MAG: sulfotransferase [Pseudomonadota bacterium]|nr:sulfotransferase [Pseudomonadota bacterium]